MVGNSGGRAQLDEIGNSKGTLENCTWSLVSFSLLPGHREVTDSAPLYPSHHDANMAQTQQSSP